MDEDVASDDFIGEGNAKLSSFTLAGGIDEWFEIYFKGKSAGKIHFRCEWEPK